jgi:[ribosomal protein S5]-alanine N-acetyltransferase
MQTHFITERLTMEPLAEKHNLFIIELLNTDGWIKFIGDRNIHSTEDALKYIERINNNATINYWVVTHTAENAFIGLVTLIKRDYLQHHDIGFAFLPQFSGHGYAYEASNKLLHHLLVDKGHTTIEACTLPENIASIKLIEKLGLNFKEQISHNNELLSIYSISKL